MQYSWNIQNHLFSLPSLAFPLLPSHASHMLVSVSERHVIHANVQNLLGSAAVILQTLHGSLNCMPAATCSSCSQHRPARDAVTLLMTVTREWPRIIVCISPPLIDFVWKDYHSCQKQWGFCLWDKNESSKPEGKTLVWCNFNILQPSPTRPIHNQIGNPSISLYYSWRCFHKTTIVAAAERKQHHC